MLRRMIHINVREAFKAQMNREAQGIDSTESFGESYN
jgi:hypothetical protein